MSDKLLLMLDASAFSNSSCILRLFNTVVEGYKQKLENNDICFGTAFHIFRKIFREKGEQGVAEGINKAKEYFINTPMIEKYNKKYLTPVFLMRICIEYAEKYAKDSFKPIRIKIKKKIKNLTKEQLESLNEATKTYLLCSDNSEHEVEIEESLLEIKGACPYYVDDDMEILMAFTMDEIGKQENGIVSIMDAKTTSMWDIKSYFQSFELSPQLRFYKWSLFKYAEAYPESFIGKLCEDIIGCQIDGIFYKGADKEVEYKRSEVMLFSDDPKMEEFDKLVERKVFKLIDSIKLWRSSNRLPLREGILNGSCETKYGKCDFSQSCAAVDETTRNVILDYNFIKKHYNPLEFNS